MATFIALEVTIACEIEPASNLLADIFQSTATHYVELAGLRKIARNESLPSNVGDEFSIGEAFCRGDKAQFVARQKLNIYHYNR